jgi:hypothetical protein
MDRNQPTEEQRDAKIAELTEAGVAAWTARVRDEEPRALADLQNTVLDRLSLDDAKGIFAAALLSQAAGNAMFSDLVQRAMYDQCEVEAIKQVEQIEARRVEEQRRQRIERRVFDRQFGVLA